MEIIWGFEDRLNITVYIFQKKKIVIILKMG